MQGTSVGPGRDLARPTTSSRRIGIIENMYHVDLCNVIYEV